MSKNYTVLVCDDASAVHESLSRFLIDEGMEVVSVQNGEAVIKAFKSIKIDLMILDIMLPGISGTEVCRQIRKESDIPIIFLSARGEEIDRIVGLEVGADDYVTKPFSPREVALRVKKILSRLERTSADAKDEGEILEFEELRIETEKMKVSVAGQELEMTPKEVNLLAYLVRNKHKVLNREQILQAVWGYDYYGDTRAVDAVIKRIRKKLPEEGLHFEIQSIYGVGYRLGGTA